jgi:anti-sigma B factor antagonist
MPIQSWSENIIVADLQDDPSCTDDLNALIEQLADKSDVDLVLDFSSVSYLNSSNIAKLLKLRKLVVLNHQRKLMLCSINSHVWGVFLITGLERLFEFSDSVALGLTSIQIDATE